MTGAQFDPSGGQEYRALHTMQLSISLERPRVDLARPLVDDINVELRTFLPSLARLLSIGYITFNCLVTLARLLSIHWLDYFQLARLLVSIHWLDYFQLPSWSSATSYFPALLL